MRGILRTVAERWGRALLAGLTIYVSLVDFYYIESQTLASPQLFSLVKYGPFALACAACALWVAVWCLEDGSFIPAAVDGWLGLHWVVSLFSLWVAIYARIGLEKWVYYHATGPV